MTETAEVEVGLASADWLSEAEGKRLRRLEAISEAKFEVTTDGVVKVEAGQDKQHIGGLEWAQRCLLAMCNSRTGQSMACKPLPDPEAYRSHLTVVNVPKDGVRPYVMGKGGTRLLQLAEEVGVIAVFVEESGTGGAGGAGGAASAGGGDETLEPGDLVEAKFGNKDRLFEAKVLSVEEDEVTLKWTYDDDVAPSTVPRKDVIRKLSSGKPAKTEEQAPSDYEVGDLVEAKFGKKGRSFEAKVIAVNDRSLRLKWTYDDDVPEDEVPKSDVIRVIESAKVDSAVQELEAGDLIEAKFQGKEAWFEARVVKVVSETTLRVKWTYDDDVPESDVSRREVRCKAPVECATLHIIGCEERARMDLELKVLNLMEAKLPGFVANQHRKSTEGDGLGCSIVPLVNAGELKAKVIGKGGAVRIKIGKACNVVLEYLGIMAYIVGTGPERAAAAALLELVQTAGGSVEKVPDALESICTRTLVPADLSTTVSGKQRGLLNQLEDDTGTLSFWAPAEAAENKTLVIFGPERARKTVELRVMDIVESQRPGSMAAYLSSSSSGAEEGFKVLAVELGKAELKKCKAQPSKRARVAAAAGCLVEPVGDGLYVAGTAPERALGLDYLRYLGMEQPSVPDVSSRTDMEEFMVAESKVSNLTDFVLNEVAVETGTFCFYDDGARLVGMEGCTRLIICGQDAAKRALAVTRFKQAQEGTWKREPFGSKASQDNGAEQEPTRQRGGEKRKVLVVSAEEEERRRKRAARFGQPAPAKMIS